MWPFWSRALFPPPTEAWLQRVCADPEAQGWGAWGGAEEAPLGSGAGAEEEEEEEERRAAAEDDEDGAGAPLPLLGRGAPAEHPVPNQELEAIRRRLRAMECARPPGSAREDQGAGAALPGQLWSPPPGCLFPGTPKNVEADHRSVYVGNVDYGGSAEELEAHFHPCGDVHRVTILCDKFSGHPKGYAYIEFAARSSALAAVELHESVFRGRVIKVLPKRTNFPGVSSTDRGGRRGARAGPRLPPRGRHRARGRLSPWFPPY
ncbi:embryonic polyadenylate-binding protein 2 [Dasypus novemcinctus]|uniref:embryonic polyadenylate-binding protein 2 n=1 Tax=Dasypus novemcinctus TaxID=9361 RepID=UPI00265F93B1|nr:embryonic polyadenylate-binding protein 2 [Dasypus novemcinctus]